MQAQAQWLSGERLHLQHGPIDLIIGQDGGSGAGFEAAEARFATVLAELMDEIDLLRQAVGPEPKGSIARHMHKAVLPLAQTAFITPMAAVAGAVADTVLAAMVAADPGMTRAYVNNGGDIALHLGQEARYRTAILGHDGQDLGRVSLREGDPVRGMATSGRHGRSFSLGIADSVTVLAASAAQADAAATLIANAVDRPGHPAIRRKPAEDIQDDSDLAGLQVVTGVDPLPAHDRNAALTNGASRARALLERGLIAGAVLHLQGETLSVTTDDTFFDLRSLAHV